MYVSVCLGRQLLDFMLSNKVEFQVIDLFCSLFLSERYWWCCGINVAMPIFLHVTCLKTIRDQQWKLHVNLWFEAHSCPHLHSESGSSLSLLTQWNHEFKEWSGTLKWDRLLNLEPLKNKQPSGIWCLLNVFVNPSLFHH